MANKTLAEMEGTECDARNRLVSLFDEDSFVELDKFVSSNVITGYGQINGAFVYAFAEDPKIGSGGMTGAAASKILKIYSMAVKNGSPVVAVYNSNGGDVQEGNSLLAAYGRIVSQITKLSGVVPQVSVVAGVCAGASAMLCCMSDIVIMTEDSELFITPPFVADDGKIAGAGKAENAAKSGVASIIVKDMDEAVQKVKSLISILPQNNLELGGNDLFIKNEDEISPGLKGEDMAKAIADIYSLIEIGADFGDASYTALGSINLGKPCRISYASCKFCS